jgi:hypothetical protein
VDDDDDDSVSDDDDSGSDDDDSATDDDDSTTDDDDSATDDDDSVSDDDDSASDDDDSVSDDDDSASDDDDSAAGDDDDSSSFAGPMVFISEVAEPGAPTPGTAKFVEIFNAGSGSAPLDTFTLHRYANGSSTATSVALSGVVQPGETYVICNQPAEFLTVYGLDADLGAPNVVTGNGDDVYELRDGGVVIDTYGEVGVDGTGTVWEYTNTLVLRLPGSAPNFGAIPVDPSLPLDMSEWLLTPWVDALNAGSITPGTHTN